MTVEKFKNALEKLEIKYKIESCNNEGITWYANVFKGEIDFSENYSNTDDIISFITGENIITEKMENVCAIEFSPYGIIRIEFKNNDFWKIEIYN